MLNPSPKILVIGCDGTIGSHLRAYLESQGRDVVGTTRRPERVGDSTLLLDMAGDVAAWPVPPGVTAAVICAGVSSVGACATDPAGTAEVNVRATVALAKSLASAGCSKILFLSSGHVFDGDTPLAAEDSAQAPITEYGRQKADAERRLATLGNIIAIVRLSNVLAPDNSLIGGWSKALNAGNSIRPFSDMTMAPVPLSFVSRALARIIDQPTGRTWQISGEKDVSYAVAARAGAILLGLSPDLVQPIRAADAGYSERIRRYTSMDSSRLQNELALSPPSVDQTIRLAFTDPAALGRIISD